MQAPSAPFLRAHDLACRRGDRILFRSLSLDLAVGDALHITGANGMGKTTLIRSLAGLLSPYAGHIEKEGAFGLLDDRPSIDPDLPLGKAIRFWARVDGCNDILPAAQKLGLDDLLDVPVQYLSTGQKKRAALFTLLNNDAPIWLLDEPLSGLDKPAIVLVTSLIENHRNNGGIAVIASHQTVAIEGLKTLAIEDYAL
ncbi:MAG: heme ABC exporter ATP-binding protein CcmA [Pseudomonadota bacterium]